MFPVTCPRCTLVWYSNEKAGGRVRLCSDCADALKRNRRWDPAQIDAFVIATGVFVLVDLLFIPLAALLPGTFGTPLLVYGAVLSVGAFLVYSGFQGELYGVKLVEKADWSLMRWPVMVGPAGLACVMAYYSLGIPAWKEKHPPGQGGVIQLPPSAGGGLYRPGDPPPGVRPGPQTAGATSPPREPPAATGLPGLLGYWSFDDDSQAPKVMDLSGKGNHATVKAATETGGMRGKALAFNGKDAYLDYGSSPDFNFAANAPFTLACWVKTRTGSGVICGQRSSTDEAAGILLTVDQALPTGLVRQDHGTAPARVVGRNATNDNAWHHLALTRDAGGTIKLFCDGASQAQATAAGVNGPITTDLRMLGAEPRAVRQGRSGIVGVSPYLSGAVDEFCILGRKLTDEEIRTLAGRLAGPTSPASVPSP